MNILFIGNSYSDQISGVLRTCLDQAGHRDTAFSVVWGGGATLRNLIDKGRAREAIGRGGWDVVVLQEQSQVPALGGAHRRSFDSAVDALVPCIREIGAEPLLYMTWGRQAADPENPELFPDYDTMQRKLTVAYQEAATRHDLRVAAVGEVWASVRERDSELGRALYQSDGSHPSALGAFLASCVFLHLLFDDALVDVAPPDDLGASACALITETVRALSTE